MEIQSCSCLIAISTAPIFPFLQVTTNSSFELVDHWDDLGGDGQYHEGIIS